MSNQIELTTKYIRNLTPMAVVLDKVIGEHFVNKSITVNKLTREEAVAFCEREKDNFASRISATDALKECTSMSIYNALMQVGSWGLSFQSGSQSDVYLIPGNRNVGTKEQPNWIKEVIAQPSPYGEKKIRIRNRQIKHVSSLVIVYDCDSYSEKLGDNGRIIVQWEKGNRTEKSKITGSFILLEYPDGSREFKTFDMDDVNTWKEASAKKNKGTANHMYTSNNGQITKSFFESKTLKHAFKLFPRVIEITPLPENFVPVHEESVRHGFDTSEFTDEPIDTSYEEVKDSAMKPNDDFDNELSEAKVKEPVEQTQFAEAQFDDEPNFD